MAEFELADRVLQREGLSRRSSPAPAAVECANAAKEDERLFWRLLVENAAASEVTVNVLLPWCLCEFHENSFRHLSETFLSFVVLALNLLGAFAEGFCKSTRLLSQPLRHSKPVHQLVFLTSQGFADGFLNVLTSFPDIAGSAATLALTYESLMLGTLYCVASMTLGVACYIWGRAAGRDAVKLSFRSVVTCCTVWPSFARLLVFGALALAFFPRGHAVPLDLTQPELAGVEDVRFVYDEYAINWKLPPMVLGLSVGMFMSASGAACAAIFCDVLFEERARPTARFLTNLVSTALVLAVRQVVLPDDAVKVSFIFVKFSASFCGALSAFSGTVGDVADLWLGSAQRESALQGERRGWLPRLTSLQNFLMHLGFLLLVMALNVRWADDVKPPPIVLQMRGRSRGWIRERPFSRWHVEEDISQGAWGSEVQMRPG